VLWLPDVFGYAWCLPQLVKQAGLDYFMTIKISWSEYNRLPYDSFWWQGLDGTRLLTHFSTVPERGSSTTYNAAATPQQVTGAWENFQQKELQHVLLMAYGFGDGGGGPTRETLENLREMEAFPSIPRARQGKVIDFFQQMEQEAGPRLPVWNGELYLEYHRGTYTTQAANKRANRKSEFLLHDAEYLATQATLMDETYEYPHDMLRQAWKLVCLNQFHDIIPGSSIREVYVESLVQYTEVGRLAGAVRDEATEVIQRHCSGALLLLNPSSFKRSDLAFWSGDLPPVDSLGRDDGRPVMIQPAQGGIWIDAGEIAPYSGLCLQWTGEAAPQRDTSLRVTPTLLENQHLRVEFNDAGDITRIYDRRNGREVLSPGTIANQFQAFEDRPKNWDAWDIDINYDDRMWVAEPASAIEVIEEGPLRATLQITRQILHSTFTQRISLTHNSARLDFDTTVQWRERHILLKVAFPVDILAPAATYEIQWGNVERPTHRNTSWDWARFESFAQKWVDLSEGGYGVSLLNDCKYGHDIQDNVLRLSLLRAPTWPDPEADQGEHRFTYSLLPHRGDWREETIPAAYALNDPLLVSGITGSGPEGRSIPSLVSVSQPHVVIETVKQAEDGDGIIVRLYESQRQRGAVSLTTGFSLQQAWLVNLLEENQSPLAAKDNRVEFSIRPFQIVTLRLVPIARRA
jgi:alpha-mannosidase